MRFPVEKIGKFFFSILGMVMEPLGTISKYKFLFPNLIFQQLTTLDFSVAQAQLYHVETISCCPEVLCLSQLVRSGDDLNSGRFPSNTDRLTRTVSTEIL